MERIRYPLLQRPAFNKSRLTGGARWPTNEGVKTAESIKMEEKVTTLHTEVQRKEAPDTEEVTKTGGRRTKKSIDNTTM